MKPGVQVSGGRSSERDGIDGFAIDIEGRFNEIGAILGSKLSPRRGGGAVAEGGEVMAARAGCAGEGVGVGVEEAARRRGSSKALRSGSENLIARAAQQAIGNVCMWCVGGKLMWGSIFLHEETRKMLFIQT